MTSSENALEQLISQFAQPLAFLRELIQNSLDANTTVIEVEVAYDEESDCCFVRVADNGHGMDREVIDKRLTTLFASTKENDFTKIGKFGIGFVSIFAIKPELVVLETGQHGEAWRLLFLPDRSFERRELSEPVDGTSVTVFLPRKREALESLMDECRDTVVFWCKHSKVEILFNGEPINQKFELPGAIYQYRHKVEGTEAVVAPCEHSEGFHGYYNRGLTLLEGVGSPIRHVSFKLRSRYLEHTLSRDNIKRDENYEKAMRIVKKAALEEMPKDLFSRLAEQDDDKLWRAARIVIRADRNVLKQIETFKIFPTSQGRVSFSELPSPRCYYGPEVDELWEEVEKTGEVILLIPQPAGDIRLNLLNELCYQPRLISEEFFRYRAVEAPEEDESDLLAVLKKTTRQILSTPFLLHSLNTPAVWEKRFCAYLNPRESIVRDPDEPKGWRDAIGIRRDHPFWSKLLQLWRAQPELAISMLVRKVNLELDISRKQEGKLFHNLVKSARERLVT